MTIEGLDFSGKTTLVRELKNFLPEAYFTREPGGTPVAERVREIVLDPTAEMDAWTEAYLYAAARADHVRGEILPRLIRGQDVICERYLDSSLAYQGVGRRLGLDPVRGLNSYAIEPVMPDRTFYLKVSPEERGRRAAERGDPDRIEAVGADFMRRVEEGFDQLTRLEPGRIEVIDAARPPRELADLVVERMRGLHYTRNDGSS